VQRTDGEKWLITLDYRALKHILDVTEKTNNIIYFFSKALIFIFGDQECAENKNDYE
jgi:hypothetical protein